MNRFWKRLRTLWRRGQLDRDLEDELSFHQAMLAEETGDAAEARRRLGNPTALKEKTRELWMFTWIETIWQDVRYALRTLVRNPGFTAVAVSALALGTGANTTLYTVVSSALRFDMGVDQIERLVIITATDESRRDGFGQSIRDFRDFRGEVKSVESLAAYRFAPVNLSDPHGLPERYNCVEMSTNGFSVARVQPVLGRDFTVDDERPDAPAVLMLTYRVGRAVTGKTRRSSDRLRAWMVCRAPSSASCPRKFNFRKIPICGPRSS